VSQSRETAPTRALRRPASSARGRPAALHHLAGSAAASLALLAVVLAATSCGGSTTGEVTRYLGTWLRVEAGEPNPAFTLVIAGTEHGADITLSNQSSGMRETVAATLEDGSLACVLPSENDPPSAATSPAPAGTVGAPAASDLRLSLGENGQLVVDLVLPDGTLEPIWIYERASGRVTAEP